MLTPLNLTTSVLFGPLDDVVEGRSGRANLPEQLALGDPGQPLAGPLQPVRADVDQVVQLEVDHRDDRRIGNAIHDQRAGRLARRSSPGDQTRSRTGRSGRSKTAARAGRNRTDRRDEVGKDLGIDLPRAPHGVALALVPEHAA